MTYEIHVLSTNRHIHVVGSKRLMRSPNPLLMIFIWKALVVLPIQNTENMIQMYKICWIISHKQNNVFMLYMDRLSWTSLQKKTMKNSCANKVQMSLLYICPILCVNQHFVSIEMKWRGFSVSIKHISSNVHVVLRSGEMASVSVNDI